MHQVEVLMLCNNQLHVELYQLSGKVLNELEQYIVKNICEVEDMKEAHEDSLVAHLESCKEAEKNKDEAREVQIVME